MDTLPFNRWAVLKRFLFVSFALAVVVVAVSASLYRADLRGELGVLSSREEQGTRHQGMMIIDELRHVVSDLMYLSEESELGSFLEGDRAHPRNTVVGEYASFIKRKGFYDQVRFIDSAGMEVVRVDMKGGSPVIAPEAGLQSKADRDYFSKTMRLDRGGVYISAFDLNVEKGEVEMPLKPVVRLATPVFDSRGRRRGVVVLNYLGADLIKKLKAAFIDSPGVVMLLNANGYYLSGQRPEDEWGFMFEHMKGKTFGNDYPDAWQRISAAEAGQFYGGAGLFTFVTVHLPRVIVGRNGAAALGHTDERQWKIVSFVPSFMIGSGERKMRYLLSALGLFGVGAFAVWLLARADVERSLAEQGLAKAKDELEERVEERTRELKALNERLLGMTEELRNREAKTVALLEMVDRMNSEIMTSSRYKQAFFSNISHELKTPLNHIIGFSELLTMDGCAEDDEKCNAYAENIHRGGKDLLRLINALLDISRDDVTVTVDWHEFSVREAVEDVLKSVRPSAELKRLRLTANLEREVETFRGDAGMFREILLSLVENAVKFTPSAGTVDIDMRQILMNEREFLEVRVADNGIGVRAEDRETIFKAFETGGDGKGGYRGGAGIGLALAKRFVDYHGGRIWVEGEEGSGSTFVFTIPSGAEGEKIG